MQHADFVVQTQVAGGARRKYALVTDVVNGHHGTRAFEQRIPGVGRLEEQRCEGGVPVVAVDNVWRPREALATIEYRAGEGNESQVFVTILRVHAASGKQCIALNQEQRRGRFGQRYGCHRKAEAMSAKFERQVLQRRHWLRMVRGHVNVRVLRHEKPHIVASGVQKLGQRPGDIRQPAGLGERCDFGCQHANLETHATKCTLRI